MKIHKVFIPEMLEIMVMLVVTIKVKEEHITELEMTTLV